MELSYELAERLSAVYDDDDAVDLSRLLAQWAKPYEICSYMLMIF